MILLSLDNNDLEKNYLCFNGTIEARMFQDGNSYVRINSKDVLGVCVGCDEKYCIEYSESELFPEQFASFPKNTSQRVCPTEAIYIDDNDQKAHIDQNSCIRCGLCIYRCPFSAIQYSISNNRCTINEESNELISCTKQEQTEQVLQISQIAKTISYGEITGRFSEKYMAAIQRKAYFFPDLSEIIVRNTLVNAGYKCQTNAQGNNHIRIEIIAQKDNCLVMGESEQSNTDTLSVTRRLLDNLAVLISRYSENRDSIIPLSIINGLPNKRTDYYEVITDIRNAIGIQISTITYHILYVINLLSVQITPEELRSFVVDNMQESLLTAMTKLIPDIFKFDKTIYGINYTAVK